MNTLAELLSPAQLVERLEWRYATKQFDSARTIDAETWTALEDALVLSPSSAGLQPWAFYVVTDPAIRERLLPASYGQSQVKDASHLVVFTAKKNFGVADVDAHIARTAEVRGVSVGSLQAFRDMIVGGIVNAKDDASRLAWAGRQATIALGTLLTSAAILGVDACPMEGFVPEQYDAILGLEARGLTTIAICALGYRSSDDKYAHLPKVRFPKSEMIRYV